MHREDDLIAIIGNWTILLQIPRKSSTLLNGSFYFYFNDFPNQSYEEFA